MGYTAISRRGLLVNLLRIAALGATTSLIAACGASPAPASPSQTTAPTPTPATNTAGTAPSSPTSSAGAAGQPTVNAQASTSKEHVTIRYMDRAGALGEFMRHFAKVYEERHPNITVKLEDASWGDLVTKVATYVAAGTMADVAFQHAALMLPELAAKGVWLDLEPHARADKLDFSIFYPWALQTCRQGPNNTLVALPMGVHTGQNNHLMYNVEMLDKAGVKPPSSDMSVEDLTMLAVELKKALPPDVWPIMTPIDAWTMEGHARSWKGYIVSEDRKSCGFALPETQAAHQYVYDWINKYKVMPGPQQAQGGQSQLFYNQKLAIAINCSPNLWVGFNDAVKGKFTMGNAIWPKKPSGVIGTVPSADATVIYGKTKYPEEAWGLVSLLSSFEASKWAAVNPPNMTPGAVIKAWHDEEVWKINPPYKVDAEWWDTLTEVGNMPVPANTRHQEFFDAYNNGWQAMAYGTVPYTKENIEALQKKLQAIMDKPLP